MNYCAACGHALDGGRFCARCGASVATPYDGPDPRTDTAERPAVPDPHPAHRGTPAPLPEPEHTSAEYAARFPLFADELGGTDPEHTAVLPGVREAVASSPATPREAPAPPPRRLWPVFVGIGVVLALALALGVWLLGSGDDTPQAGAPASPGTSAGGRTAAGKSDQASPGPGDAPVAAPADPTDLAPDSRPRVPSTAPPNQDVRGNTVRYVAANMLDGRPDTAWRMAGDGTGRTLAFRLPAASVITRVGLVNGYAKLDRDRRGNRIDWYQRNRRITEVEWLFDDGTSVRQSLKRTPDLQTIPVDPVRTRTVRLRLLSVSAPGARNGRNYTPISEVAIVGG